VLDQYKLENNKLICLAEYLSVNTIAFKSEFIDVWNRKNSLLQISFIPPESIVLDDQKITQMTMPSG